MQTATALSRKHCPECGEALYRVRADAAGGAHAPPGLSSRYRCANLACGWQGAFGQRAQDRAHALEHAAVDHRRARRLQRWAFALVALAGVAVAQSAWLMLRTPPPRPVAAAVVPAGQSHDGEALPAAHPWSSPGSLQREARTAAPGTQLPPRMTVDPLEMRRNCSWGVPGRNPYKGSVEQALMHARLPAEVVQEVAQRVRLRQISDRVEITRTSIKGQTHGREFDPESFALTFAKTLCLNARVNFKEGHTELADLYEVTDRAGRPHAVMVPDVCGNVSVLGMRGKRREPAASGADGGAGDRWPELITGRAPGEASAVPEPSTLALLLLVGAGWAARQGLRARHARRHPAR